MGSSSPSVAQRIPLYGVSHDFIHGWQGLQHVSSWEVARSWASPLAILDGLLLVLGHEVCAAVAVPRGAHGKPRQDGNVSTETDVFGVVNARCINFVELFSVSNFTKKPGSGAVYA